MDISVVIPVYNSEKTIAQVLDSVRTQTALGLIKEVIVVNDGSTDRSHDMITAYREAHKDIMIRLIDKENGGVAAARNDGVKAAIGEWIAFLDADDLWLPEKIERQWHTIIEHPEIDFLGCGHNNTPLKILGRKINTLYKVKIKDLCLKSFPVTPSIIVKKSVFEAVGGFDEDFFYMEDAAFCFQVCVAGYGYYYLPNSLVNTDFLKPFYGSFGLSSNLKEMHYGEIRNIKALKTDGFISDSFYLYLRGFYSLKYFRRLSLQRWNQKKLQKNANVKPK